LEIKEHPWLKNYPWKDLYAKKIESPFIPKNQENFDKKYCQGPDKIGQETLERYKNFYKNDALVNVFNNYSFDNIISLHENNINNNNNNITDNNNKAKLKTYANNTTSNNENNYNNNYNSISNNTNNYNGYYMNKNNYNNNNLAMSLNKSSIKINKNNFQRIERSERKEKYERNERYEQQDKDKEKNQYQYQSLYNNNNSQNQGQNQSHNQNQGQGNYNSLSFTKNTINNLLKNKMKITDGIYLNNNNNNISNNISNNINNNIGNNISNLSILSPTSPLKNTQMQFQIQNNLHLNSVKNKNKINFSTTNLSGKQINPRTFKISIDKYDMNNNNNGNNKLPLIDNRNTSKHISSNSISMVNNKNYFNTPVKNYNQINKYNSISSNSTGATNISMNFLHRRSGSTNNY
jgi:hypothetical protein